ncbi:hypothetical protein J25TS5_04130 [Paenibacillus faecis]|nr:hypothetical protein J25TS5_04130 [Paenibacillus faecis]
MNKPTVRRHEGYEDSHKEERKSIAHKVASEVFGVGFLACLGLIMLVGTYKTLEWMLSQ